MLSITKNLLWHEISQALRVTLGGIPAQGESLVCSLLPCQRAQRALGWLLFMEQNDWLRVLFEYQQGIWVTAASSSWLPCCHLSPKVQRTLAEVTSATAGGSGVGRAGEGRVLANKAGRVTPCSQQPFPLKQAALAAPWQLGAGKIHEIA